MTTLSLPRCVICQLMTSDVHDTQIINHSILFKKVLTTLFGHGIVCACLCVCVFTYSIIHTYYITNVQEVGYRQLYVYVFMIKGCLTISSETIREQGFMCKKPNIPFKFHEMWCLIQLHVYQQFCPIKKIKAFQESLPPSWECESERDAAVQIVDSWWIYQLNISATFF